LPACPNPTVVFKETLTMHWYQYITVLSLAVFILACCYHLFRLIRLGKPVDFAPPAGTTGPAILYSFTGAMNPLKKESAFLHLPTYSAGIIYHLGTFLSISLFFLLWFMPLERTTITHFLSLFLLVSVGCGIGILFKRLLKKDLRKLSIPDDYISNVLVSLFQLMSVFILEFSFPLSVYYLITSLLLLYFPLGKLKHAIYFFAARYHLGFFYGWRGIWPPRPLNRM
jgi:hypothetical protein